MFAAHCGKNCACISPNMLLENIDDASIFKIIHLLNAE